jgi:hypothetical protein
VYSFIWRHLPGPTAAKAASALLLIVAASAVLLFLVFPHVVPYLPFNGATAGP